MPPESAGKFMRYPVPVGVYDLVVTAPGRADACVHVRSGIPTRKYTLLRNAGVAVKTLQFDISLRRLRRADVDLPLSSLTGDRPDERRVWFVTVFTRRVHGVSRSDGASQVRMQPMLAHRIFASRDP